MPNLPKPLEGRDARIAAAQSWARAFSYECEGALEGKPPKQVIVVPGRIVNIVA